MSQGGDFGSRAKARARALVDGADAARRHAEAFWPAGAAAARRLGEKLAAYAAAEIAPGRLFAWVPVVFGFGIVLYFTADREPALWAVASAAVAGIGIAYAARRSAAGFPIAVAFAALAAGFAIATLKTAAIGHPVLQRPTMATLAGYIEIREERAKTDRVVVRVAKIDGTDAAPDRVRVSVRKGTAPAVGDYVSLKARLTPPLEPLRPGGYDFARDMFFQRVGASGYVLGPIKKEAAPAPPGFGLRYAALVDAVRETIDDRIREILPGDQGSIASALITGKRDAITTPVNDAMYISSLGHVLSISGYHMAVVAGIVFFIIRASLALVPAVATRYPIKKWAAVAAFIAASFYLVLSGAEVATQRSFIMIAIVLIGVMFDRPALTFRTLTIAALAVLLLAPQAVVHPSFQMSFAATLALIAAYQHGLPWRANADSAVATRAALWGAREVTGLILASLVAGLATTPYVAFHFHRLAPYGVLANLFAMPVVSAWVMPMGILGLLMQPFGFDAPFWRMMGWGIDWMIAVAQWVAGLPGAVGQVAAFGTGPLLLATLSLLLLCLLRTPLRWTGAVLALIAALWAYSAPRPDVLVAGDGQAAAMRGEDGRLSILHSGRDSFAVREWLAADADSRTVADKTLSNGVRCDKIGCVGQLPDGRLVAMALSAEALAEDCRRAAVVISTHKASPDCAALTLDRDVLRQRGASSVRIDGKDLVVTWSRPGGYVRPWAQLPFRPAVPAASPDATPPLKDLEPDDQ